MIKERSFLKLEHSSLEDRASPSSAFLGDAFAPSSFIFEVDRTELRNFDFEMQRVDGRSFSSLRETALKSRNCAFKMFFLRIKQFFLPPVITI